MTGKQSTTDSNHHLYNELFHLPKVELHAHLNGCIREATLFSLAAERGVQLPEAYFSPAHNHNKSKTNGTVSEQQQQDPVEDTNTDSDVNAIEDDDNDDDGLLYNTLPRSLSDCFAMFAEIPKAVNDLPALQRITREALEEFAHHSCVYVEIRSTPKRLLRDVRVSRTDAATKQEYVETILQVMDDFELEEEARYQSQIEAAKKRETNHHHTEQQQKPHIRFPMKCRFLVSVDRGQTLEEATEHVDLAIALGTSVPNSRVVGMDLGGNPTKQDFALFRSEFERARKAGLKVTLHCAEIPCCDNSENRAAYQEATAVLDFAPDRLGHALLLPPDLQQRLLEARIPVETCPTSNVMTLELARHTDGRHLTLLEGLSQHENLALWIKARHPITIATDDPGVFGTNLTKELWLVARTFDIADTGYFENLAVESMEYAFCDASTKKHILSFLSNQNGALDR